MIGMVAGPEIRLFSVGRGAMLPVACRGRDGEIFAQVMIVSGEEFNYQQDSLFRRDNHYCCCFCCCRCVNQAQFDPRGSSYVYGLTRTGRLLTFHTRAGTREFPLCAIIDTQQLATTRSGKSVYVF